MIPATSSYSFLNMEAAPRHLLAALALYGTKEVSGSANNPEILKWAEECGIGGIYKADSMPWCGLFVAVCLHRAGRPLIGGDPYNILRALKWGGWGVPVSTPMLADLLIFSREGGGHVGFYVGEDEVSYHVLGGNQGNAVSVVRIAKARLVACSRPPYNNMPQNIRKIHLTVAGKLSENEA